MTVPRKQFRGQNSDLDIGVEVYYAHDSLQHSQWDENRGAGTVLKSADVWLGRFRVSRDF
jgi:hypothetical protein